jgi:hypothetical protein
VARSRRNFPRTACALALAILTAAAGCGGAHHARPTGLSRAEQTDLASRLVLPDATGVTVHFAHPIVTVATPAELLAHTDLSRAVWEHRPDPRAEAAALRRNGFMSAGGEALVDPVVNVHSDVLRFRSAIDADAALRRIVAVNRRGARLSRFTVAAIPGSKGTAGITHLPGIRRATSYRLLFTDGSFLYGEQIESLPSPEVRSKFIRATTGLYRSVRGKLGP